MATPHMSDKTSMHIRLSKGGRSKLEKLSEQLGLSMTSVIELSLRELEASKATNSGGTRKATRKPR